MRKLHHVVFALTIWLLLPRYLLYADNYMVLMDNSETIKRLIVSPRHITYLNDIIGVLKKSGENTFYFVPIGDPDRQRDIQKPWLVDSDSPPEEIPGMVARVFDFNDRYARIDGSLGDVEETDAFKETENIIIISDMEPVHRNKASPWELGESELMDVKNYVGRLGRWAETMDKKITIILHFWDRTPSMGDEKKIDSFEKDLDSAIRQTARGFVKDGKDLVGTGLYMLKKRCKGGIRLLNIPFRLEKDEMNKEGFINKLCGCLPVEDPDEEICAKSIRTDFRVLIKFSPRVHLRKKHMERLKSDLPTAVFAGPKRRIVMKEVIGSWKPGHNDGVDYQFYVKKGKGRPFRKPRVKVTFQSPSGGVESKRDLRPDGRLSSYEDMITWLKNTIELNLLRYIEEDFPAAKKSKKIFVSDWLGKPLPRGHLFLSRWRLPHDKTLNKSKICKIDSDYGVVRLNLPRLAPELELIQKASFTGGESTEQLIDCITDEQVKSRDDIYVEIRENLYKKCLFRFKGLDGGRCDFRVDLKAFDKRYKIFEIKNAEGSVEVPLLPGEYEIEAAPVRKAHLLRVLGNHVVKPNRIDEKIKREHVLHIRKDPLHGQNTAAWKKEVFGDAIPREPTENQKKLAIGSSIFLKALLRLTSNDLYNNKEDLKEYWNELSMLYFDRSKRPVHERLMTGAFLNIGLVDEDQKLQENAFAMLRAMFDMFIYGKSDWLEGTKDSTIERRKKYNDWIDFITDSRPGVDRFIGPAMADLLKHGDGG